MTDNKEKPKKIDSTEDIYVVQGLILCFNVQLIGAFIFFFNAANNSFEGFRIGMLTSILPVDPFGEYFNFDNPKQLVKEINESRLKAVGNSLNKYLYDLENSFINKVLVPKNLKTIGDAIKSKVDIPDYIFLEVIQDIIVSEQNIQLKVFYRKCLPKEDAIEVNSTNNSAENTADYSDEFKRLTSSRPKVNIKPLIDPFSGEYISSFSEGDQLNVIITETQKKILKKLSSLLKLKKEMITTMTVSCDIVYKKKIEDKNRDNSGLYEVVVNLFDEYWGVFQIPSIILLSKNNYPKIPIMEQLQIIRNEIPLERQMTYRLETKNEKKEQRPEGNSLWNTMSTRNKIFSVISVIILIVVSIFSMFMIFIL